MSGVTSIKKTFLNEFSTIVSSIVQKKIFWFLLIGFSFLTPVYRSVIRPLPAAPPILFTVNDFKLIDENGATFDTSALKRRFTILHFYFSSCPTICPKMLETTQKIEKRVRGLGQNISILSVTIDPINDTPNVIFPLARKLRANPFVWKFLTGSENQIQGLLNSFKQSPVLLNKEFSANELVHSSSYFVMDKGLNVRGIYQNNVSEVNRMMIDIGLMVNRI